MGSLPPLGLGLGPGLGLGLGLATPWPPQPSPCLPLAPSVRGDRGKGWGVHYISKLPINRPSGRYVNYGNVLL